MGNDMPLGLSYEDVLLIPQHSEIASRRNVDLSTQISPRVKLNLPLISINMSDVTGVEMAIALGKLGGIGFLPRFVSPEIQSDMVFKVKKENVQVGAAVGIKEGYLERAESLVTAGCDILTIDIAHAHMQRALDATSKLKERFGNSVDIISGVVATYEGARDLFAAGADSARVGVGPGTICITRIVTGVGVPQITAVLEASKAAREAGKTILCDGGTKNSGDIAKGLAAGAHAVIIGSQFAGADETPGKLITKNGKKFKTYNASTSETEKKNHIKRNVQVNASYINHIEGVESLVPYKGKLSDIVLKMESNLMASFSYCGSKNLDEFHQRAKFMRVTQQGVKESRPHDVLVNTGQY